MKEIASPEGYVLNSTKYPVTVSENEEVITINAEDKPIEGYIEIKKKDSLNGASIGGAIYGIYDADGKEVQQLTTKAGTYVRSKALTYGSYTIKEIVAPEGYVLSTRTYNATIKTEDQNSQVTVEDKPIEGYIQVVKKDSKSGKTIVKAHTVFEVYRASDDSFIDTITTNSAGKAKTDLLRYGDYYLKEKTAPYGYAYSETKIKYQIREEGKTYTLHEDLSPLGFNLANDFTFKVTKEKENQTVEMIDTLTEVNKVDVDGKGVKGATLAIVSEKTKNIVDQWVTGQHIIDFDKDIKSQLEENGKAEGTYMDDEDSMVIFSISKNKDDYTLMQVKDGVTTYVNIDLDGNETTHRVQGLTAGEKYILRETKTPEGYVHAKEIKFIASEDKDISLVMKDKKVSFTKTDVTGGKEVEGAEITVIDKETGKVIDQWTSTKDSHFINGLEEGKTYILSETVTPDDYVKATDIEFKVTDEKVDQKINMKDKQVKVSKTTAGGYEIVGASMQIRDEFGNIIDEWISDGKEHYATGLVEGKKYTLHEDLAPTGFNLANDFEFEVSEEKDNQTVEMIDTLNEISKVDEKGDLLKGAEITVTSNKTKNIIDKWLTGQHILDVTDEMKSQLKTYDKAEGSYTDDDSQISYTIIKNKGKDDYTLILVKGDITTYTNIDLDGNETRHMIHGLVAGEEYVLKETKTPDGYATFKTQKFTARKDKDISLLMTDEDTKVEVSKQDITTKKELEGAELKVTDKDGNVIDEWTSGKQPHMIKNLTVGETYTLTEVIAPKNYKVAESVRFTVKDTGKIQRVIMYDRPVNNYVETGDENNYYFILMLICMIFIWRLLKSYLNNFID